MFLDKLPSNLGSPNDPLLEQSLAPNHAQVRSCSLSDHLHPSTSKVCHHRKRQVQGLNAPAKLQQTFTCTSVTAAKLKRGRTKTVSFTDGTRCSRILIVNVALDSGWLLKISSARKQHGIPSNTLMASRVLAGDRSIKLLATPKLACAFEFALHCLVRQRTTDQASYGK